ncbi:response regulator [Cohnella sp. CFH 77786]|uniref:response regulator n=1 Tax=Cohnella sp. CFH 77786 TaxID=2662265 RepID=UPI001C60BF7E|nr:response regulator [Cohnella sp. CFH 77786]
MYSVLLVDDEPRAIEGLQLFVDWERLGFRVCGTCENGEEALETIRVKAPDVVVTDIRMPGMDGLDLIGRLRAESDSAPEIVVLSAYGEFAYAKRALQLGVRHYLLKPIIGEEAAEVLGEVRSRLESRRSGAAGGEAEWEAREAEDELPAWAIREVNGILEAIESLDRTHAAERLRGLFAELGSRSPAWSGLIADHLAIQCVKLVQVLGGDPSGLGRGPGSSAGGPEGLIAFAELTIEAVRAGRDRKPGGLLSEVDRFLREFYRDSLTIKQVAARFYVNPVYLGKAYQEKFGRGMLDRIHDLRIEEACRLLRETNRQTGDIASRVGYAQYNHFLHHFEKRTGLKPAEYRAAAK